MIALLRGVNVGGRNKVLMADLRAEFERLGHGEVSTHLQSGNVVFEPAEPKGSRSKLAAAITEMLAARLGVSSVVVLRTGNELAAARDASPYVSLESDLARVHLLCLDRVPEQERVATLDPEHSPPDQFEVVGDNISVWYPSGSARSKISVAYFDKALGVVSTARNLRTIDALISKDRAPE